MSSLKDALIRVSRVARNIEQIRQPARPPPQPSFPASQRASNPEKPKRERIPKKELQKYRKQLRGFQKKRYQKFLLDLNMPDLKIYDEEIPKYDVERAEANLAAKSSTDKVAIFHRFLSERSVFNKMLDLLVDLTPQHLKSKETVSDPHALQNVLELQDNEYRKNMFPTPRYHFHEIPAFPRPLTRKSFQEYIYFLTHVKIPYRNSSSLLSGIIPEILLYTHLLTNEEFKELRSVETYNYIIKYFGYDKFQASFARELMLVMAADEKQPNLETINQLIKICRLHSTRRSLVSSYSIILKYLHLIRRMGLSVNLTTWARIYECITNIFLREAYVNKMSSINLPILSHMCVRILEDYSSTTQVTQEVIAFLCNDLKRPGWKQLPRLAEKVVSHVVANARQVDDLKPAFDLLDEIVIDEATVNTITRTISENTHLKHRTLILLFAYHRLEKFINVESTDTLVSMIKVIANENINIARANFIIRGLLHNEALKKLNLPAEFISHKQKKQPYFKHNKVTYKFPNTCISEHYRIMKRLIGDSITDFEARVLYHYRDEDGYQMPWVPLTEAESDEWKAFKELVSNIDPFHKNMEELSSEVGIEMAAKNTPSHFISAYRIHNAVNSSISRDIDLVHRLRAGLDEHLKKELEERGIYSSK